MQKKWIETKLTDLVKEAFDAKVGLYLPGVSINELDFEVIKNIIVSALRGSVKFIKNFESGKVLIRVADEKNNFLGAIMLNEEKDEEGKTSYNTSFIVNEDEFKEIKVDADKVIEATEPSFTRFLADYLTYYTSALNAPVKAVDNTAGMMYIILLALFMAIKTYVNNLTESELQEDLDIDFENEISIEIKKDGEEKVLSIEPGTGLKTFSKSDVQEQA